MRTLARLVFSAAARTLAIGVLLGLPCSTGLAQDIPLSNWTVPPYQPSPAGGFTTMTEITPPVFVAMEPCRLVDTRPSQGFSGAYGPPIMAANAIRSFDLNSAAHCPGIPAGVEAYSLNFAVTETTGAPGDIRVFPTGSGVSTTSVLNWNFVGNGAIANAIIIPAGTGGSIDILVAGFNTHLVIDINGYFSNTFGNPGNYLQVINNAPGSPAGLFGNLSNANTSTGVFGTVGPGFPRPGNYVAAGVRGEGRAGVLGISTEFGTAGSLVNGAGVEVAFGILGFHVDLSEPEITGDNVGVFGQTNDNTGGHAGVLGYAPATTGRIYGVRGVTGSTGLDAAGVRGTDGGGSVQSPGHISAGVRGESVVGDGVLGLSSGTGSCGVRGISTFGESGGLGCHFTGVFGTSVVAIGNTSFIEPHPTDASKMIRYISLEGNEAGTYFRGRGKFQNGIAVIEVPEDFRIVTDPEGLSIQVTPIQGMATVSVESIDLDRIVVRGSRNVEFFYLVHGVRHAYKDSRPIAEVEMFVPRSPDDPMPAYLPAALRERLISNGTYTADGKVNMETARRLGWDKTWEKRSRPAPQPSEPLASD